MKPFEYTWTIKEFSKHGPDDWIRSDVFFSSSKDDGVKFKLELRSQGFPEKKDNMQMDLAVVYTKKAVMRLKYECFIIMNDGNKSPLLLEYSDIRHVSDFFDNDKKNLISHEVLNKLRAVYLPNDQLTLFIRGSYSFDLYASYLEDFKLKSKPADTFSMCCIRTKFRNNRTDMLKNCKFADVTFVLNGGDEIRAHSQFLIAQSSVFAEMIEDQYSKKEKTLRIEIDIKKEAFEELLKYVYTGHCSIMDYFVQELLMAANKYKLESLQTICGAVLSQNVTHDNVVEMCHIADLLGLEHLQKEAYSVLHCKLTSDFFKMKGKREELLQMNQLMEKIPEEEKTSQSESQPEASQDSVTEPSQSIDGENDDVHSSDESFSDEEEYFSDDNSDIDTEQMDSDESDMYY